MKGFFGLLIIALVAVAVSAVNRGEEAKALIAECKVKHGVKDDAKLDNYDDEGTKCVLHCFNMKRGKAGADGKMLTDTMLAHYEKHIPNFSAEQRNLVKTCSEDANKLSKCDVAGYYYKCLAKGGWEYH